MGTKERRRFSRVAFHAPARLLHKDGAECEVEILDLSMRGALLSVPQGTRASELLNRSDGQWRLELPLSEFDTIHMEVQPAHWHGAEVGLRCLRIDLESMTHLRSLLEANLGDTEQVNRELMHLVDDQPDPRD